MIMYGLRQLAVGERYVLHITDKDCQYHEIPALVLRVATEAEYLAYVESQDTYLRHAIPAEVYFYEVSID